MSNEFQVSMAIDVSVHALRPTTVQEFYSFYANLFPEQRRKSCGDAKIFPGKPHVLIWQYLTST